MYFAGIDIGSATSKAVIIDELQMRAYHIMETGHESQASANQVMDRILEKTGISIREIAYTVATGYGRINVSFAQEVITEIACHARGVHEIFPKARTVLDMGGQDCKAIRIDGNGSHRDFIMNDKCSAGTGRFLEVMSSLLRVPIDEIGTVSLQAKEDIKISNVCTVFARSEVARHMRKGVPKADILGGLHLATAERVYSLLKRVGIEADFVISGGIAKNIGVVKRLEEKIGLPAHISEEPQIMGALGAALLARERAMRK